MISDTVPNRIRYCSLQRTNHSIRVGMACILQSQGKPGDYIQRALRWCSETWKLYTRNLWSESIDILYRCRLLRLLSYMNAVF